MPSVIIRPSALGKCLHICTNYELTQESQGWTLSRKGQTVQIDIQGSDLSVAKSRGFYVVQLGSQRLGGLSSPSASLLIQRALIPVLEQLYHDYLRIWEAPHFLREHERGQMVQELQSWQKVLLSLISLSSQFRALNIDSLYAQQAHTLYEFLHNSAELVAVRNRAFVEVETQEFKELFDRVEKLPLTPEQQVASVLFEQSNLLIAAAGSGKSSALVGKVGYALEKGLYEPQEILALAFNKAAADELAERLEKRLGDIGKQIKAKTFHSLGMEVLKSAGQLGEIEAEGAQADRIDSILERLLVSSPDFQKNWQLMSCVMPISRPEPNSFASEEEYQKCVAEKMRLKTHAEGFPTLLGQVVRSFEEIAIANWLWLHGIEFEYERPYEAGMIRMGWKKYSPDFYLVKEGVYFEHFAIDDQGMAPLFMGDQRQFYSDQAKTKQKLLKELNPRQFWTTSGEYRNGTLFQNLEKNLLLLGYEIKIKNKAQIDQGLRLASQTELKNLVKRGLSQVRSNGTSLEELEAKIVSQPDPMRARCYIHLVWGLAEVYGESLQQDGKMDFDSMIGSALQVLRDGKAKLPYRFILADEFQDISLGRARLIQAVLQNKANASLFCVGDDWQAINRFAGSDLNLFTQFDDHFGPSQSSYLTKTFRCNQGIASLSARFIMANPAQVQKDVFAHDPRTDEVCRIWECVSETAYLERIYQELTRWSELQKAKGKKGKVYFLSRYGVQNTYALTEAKLKTWSQEFAEHLDLELMTMHKSKGLESEYVVLLGIHAYVKHGFPARQDEEPLLALILPDEGAMPFADERRLFYVALTRAKEEVAIPFLAEKASPFIYELVAQERKGALLWNGSRELPKRCPDCKKGVLLKIAKKDGSFFWKCSQDKAQCKASFSQEPSLCKKCGDGLMVKKFVQQKYVMKCTEGC